MAQGCAETSSILTHAAMFEYPSASHFRKREFGGLRGRCLSKPRNLSLLVVHRGTTDLLALRIGSTRGDRAALAVGRDNDATANGDPDALLDIQPQRTVIDLRV